MRTMKDKQLDIQMTFQTDTTVFSIYRTDGLSDKNLEVRQTNRQIYGLAGRSDRHIYGLSGRADRQIDGLSLFQAEQTDRQTDKWAIRQTNNHRQTDRKTNKQTDKEKDCQADNQTDTVVC